MKAKEHSVRFLNLVDDAKTRVQEIEPAEVIRRKKKGELLNLIDVREYKEFLDSHIEHSKHISKGVLERDIHLHFRDENEELILYCSGGYRSILAADNLQKMGYTKVLSMTGGFRGWKLAGGDICIT